MTAQDGVLDLVQRWAAAEAHNDAATLDGLLDGGFAGVGPFGFILTRDQWLARFANGLVNRSFTVTDLQVRDYGTAAVGIGVLAQETSWQGTDNSRGFRRAAGRPGGGDPAQDPGQAAQPRPRGRVLAGAVGDGVGTDRRPGVRGG